MGRGGSAVSRIARQDRHARMQSKSWLVGPSRLAKRVPQSKHPQRILAGKASYFRG